MSRILNYTLILAVTVLIAGCSAGARPIYKDPAARAQLPWFNQMVLDIIETYPTDGTHDYWWPKADEPQYDGVSMDLYLFGERVLRGESGGHTYCCGLTLEVFLRAYNHWLAEHPEGFEPPLKVEDWREFQRDWFVRQVNGPGPSLALERRGMGEEIDAWEVLPGDFVQIWRTTNDEGRNSGHSVVFLEWVKDNRDRTVGMRYWSTQISTKGINENVEYFGMHGVMSTENTYYARVTLDHPGTRISPDGTLASSAD